MHERQQEGTGHGRDFPGYLGWTSRGVIAIHANWPMYPVEHGWLTALVSLCCFERGTTFTSIDDIDQCLLLSAEGLAPRGAGDDLFSPLRYHVAAWHEDLIELSRRGYVTAVYRISQRVWELNRWLELARGFERAKGERGDESSVPAPFHEWPADGPPKLPPIFTRLDDGSLLELSPPYGDGDEDELEFSEFAFMPGNTMSVTPAGWQALEEALAEQFEAPDTLSPRLTPILDAELYDTAVRETCVALEVAMATGSRTDLWGTRLVERYCRYLKQNGIWRDAGIKSLRGELRLTFKFVRNEYAHKNPETSRVRAMSLLYRLCSLYVAVSELTPAGEPESS